MKESRPKAPRSDRPPRLDTALLSRELIRALRGRRSQLQLSRRLGYSTNVAYMWEAGRGAPTASAALHAAARVGIDVRAALTRFYRVAPAWLSEANDVCSPESVSALLDDLRAGRNITALARSIGRSRFAVSRFVRGQTEPRLPDFFALIESFTRRLLDFIAAFVDPERLPSVREAWRRLDAARRAAYDVPWTQAVLRALELAEYRALPRHEPGFIAKRLGIPLDEERSILQLLRDSGQIALHDQRWIAAETMTLDTRQDPAAARRLRQHWSDVGLERARRDPDAVLSFNLATLAKADLPRVHELHRRYFAELRELASQSEPAEIILLANVQLVILEG
jgi:transcriptional regulator with XRE-family HTH domain